jgi:signal transduction histidine kinase
LKTLLNDGAGREDLHKARRVIDTLGSLAAVDHIACDRISALVRGLKIFARPERGEAREVDLNESLRNTLKLAEAEFRRRIRVETDFGELPPVECYPQMLNQVFLNILVNAGQAIEGEGEITVQTRLEADQVRISVSDSGRGMTAEQKAKAFDWGFTTKPEGIGTGLGLAISRQIVEEKHRGTIECDSRPGGGTTFHVRVPVRQARQAAGES